VVKVSDEEGYLFWDLPKKVQEQIVAYTDPSEIYDDGWFALEEDYFQEFFYELIEERLSKYGTEVKAWRKFNPMTLYYDQPRGQGPYYAYFTSDFDLGGVEVQSFIETADTVKQNGIVNNANLQFFEADKMAYGKSHIAPNLSGDAETITFSIRISPADLRSEQMSSLTSYDNFPFYIEDFEMRYRGRDIGQGVFNGYWDEKGSGHWVDDTDYDELSWAVVDEQVKPVYMWLENSLKESIYEWIVGVLSEISDGMTKQDEYQYSAERAWDYWSENDYTYFNLDGEKV